MNGSLAYQEKYEEYELINGEVYMMARPSYEHMRTEGNIFGLFDNYLRGKRCKVAFEMDVYLNEKDYVIPDVMIVCNPELFKDGKVKGAPDLVVEILSPSTARKDKLLKKALYEKYGVKEYWVVDPLRKTIEIYRLIDEHLVFDNFYAYYSVQDLERMNDEDKAATKEQQLIKVSLYDDFTIEVAEVFRGVD